MPCGAMQGRLKLMLVLMMEEAMLSMVKPLAFANRWH